MFFGFDMSLINIDRVSLSIPVNNSGQSFKRKLLGMFSRRPSINVIKVLNDVNLNINKGDRIGIIGKNGAGKSSLLRLIAGIYKPTHGSVKLNGRLLSLINLSVGINDELTGLQNIHLRLALLNIDIDNYDEYLKNIIEFSELEEFIEMPVRVYSSGMKLRLAFSIISQIQTDILIMDEWMSVGDKLFREKCEKRLNELVDNLKCFVIASHSRATLIKLTNKIAYMEKGEIIQIGDTDYMISKYL